jgi:proline dehydrogenase
MIPPLARRFVAGETVPEVLVHAADLNEQGVGAIINHLGEHYEERSPAAEDVATYERLIGDIADASLEATISVKPSQLGLAIDESVFRDNLAQIVETAATHDVFVWVDMEDHTTTDATLDAFETHATATDGGVGVCVQANLQRTREDLERLAALPGKVRLVKGAYAPPADLAYTDKARVNQAFRDDLRYMFEAFDDGVAVGSHDPEMVELATELAREYDTGYEIQMLMGVRTEAQRDLATDREVWQYVPYGDRWLSYVYRRVLERKENALFALRALLGR